MKRRGFLGLVGGVFAGSAAIAENAKKKPPEPLMETGAAYPVSASVAGYRRAMTIYPDGRIEYGDPETIFRVD